MKMSITCLKKIRLLLQHKLNKNGYIHASKKGGLKTAVHYLKLYFPDYVRVLHCLDWGKLQESLLFETSVGKLEEKLVNTLF